MKTGDFSSLFNRAFNAGSSGFFGERPSQAESAAPEIGCHTFRRPYRHIETEAVKFAGSHFHTPWTFPLHNCIVVATMKMLARDILGLAGTISLRAVSLAAAIFLGAGLAQANLITVLNSSFETATLPFATTPEALAHGSYNELLPNPFVNSEGGTLADWTASEVGEGPGAGVQAPIPGALFSSTWWNGSNIAYLDEDTPGTTASLSQTLASVLQDNTTYTLSALVGRQQGSPVAFNYAIQLWAGPNLLASASNLALGPNSFGEDSAIYTSGSNDSNAGQNLTVVLSSTWVPGGGFFGDGLTQALFDQVSLDASQARSTTPEPSTWSLGVLALIGLFIRRRPSADHVRS